MTILILRAGTAAVLIAASPVCAQTRTAAPAPQTASSGQAAANEGQAELRAEIDRLKAAVAALEARLDKVSGLEARVGTMESAAAGGGAYAKAPPPPEGKKAEAPTAVSWKGSPQFSQGTDKLDPRFKVKGRIQYDTGYLGVPSSVTDRATGISNEFRRIRLGGEGMLGGGFGYKLEAELADNQVRMVDTFITYQKGKWLVTLGNHNSFQSLDELISDTSGSVMERAAFTTAFNFERRIGLSAQYQSGPLLLQGGLFTDSVDSLSGLPAPGSTTAETNSGDKNNSFSVDGRAVFAPKLDGNQLHFAASYHWRELNRLGEGTQRYRVRPFLHSVDTRYLATPAMLEQSESHYGVEAAGVFGRFHYAGEAHWLTAYRPGLPDPTFFGAYGEVGFFLTPGDTRPYSNGILGTPKPARPFGKGGPGAIQINLRYDYLTLNDRDAGIVGGTQNGVIAAVIWTPVQYLRFNLNYAHISYTDSAILAGAVRDYDVDVVGARAELDF